jgi:hypothetical protein
MQNQQWNSWQRNEAQVTVPVPVSAGPAYPESDAAPMDPPFIDEFSKKRHPVLRGIGYAVLILVLFAMSVLAGMLSDGKAINLAAFKSAPQGEVKGESTTAESGPQTSSYSGLSVSGASEVGQASGSNDNNSTLTPSSPYYQYVETYKGKEITVARQPLPDDFKGDPANLQRMAVSVGANQPFSTDKWGKAYLMASGDVHVVMIANHQRMVFLRSLQPLSQADWKTYIDTFQLR